jgi:hypothetical protein
VQWVWVCVRVWEGDGGTVNVGVLVQYVVCLVYVFFFLVRYDIEDFAHARNRSAASTGARPSPGACLCNGVVSLYAHGFGVTP